VGDSFKLTVRSAAKVRRARFATLATALDAMEREGRELERRADAETVGGTLMRRLEPVQQVVARLELAGPAGLRVGVDVRGDGSSEAFTGRLRRRLVEHARRESAYDALRRVLEASARRR
jgi:hypothetical protein